MNRSRSRVVAVKRPADIEADRAERIQSFSIIPDFDFSLPNSRESEQEKREKPSQPVPEVSPKAEE